MNLHRLRIFCAVVEQQSYTAAAERLAVTQASVHMQVRALERSLAAQLLARSGPRMVPTEAGHEVYRLGMRMLADAEEMTRSLADLRAAQAGRVVLGASSSASYVATPLMARFQQSRPNATVHLRVAQGETICTQVLQGAFNLGIVVPLGVPEGLLVEDLCERRMLLLAPPGHRLAKPGWA